MTSDALHFYQQTLLSRLARLWRLREIYKDDLNDRGVGMLKSCYRATLRDCYDAGVSTELMLQQLCFAPPPPAKPSPEGRT
jgi:hypothetical protein